MKELLENFKSFDKFLKDQLLIGLYIQCTWALITPIVMKLQGLLWTTSFISFYLIMMRMGGLVAPYFKGTHIKKSYKMIIFINTIYVLATSLYFYDQSLFLYAESFLSIFFCINSIVLHIGWDVWVVNKYGSDTFEEYKYCATFRDGIAGIGGNAIVIGIFSLLNTTQSIRLFLFLMIFVLVLQVYNYRKHYKNMDTENESE